ncbi:hypothetical protein GGR53DRAFT_503155 [Hypoxylon sp. FL1150]|nr:hypothetical protein GGR53DRAFT_503155 [Hypoxylon sp. FL1150]
MSWFEYVSLEPTSRRSSYLTDNLVLPRNSTKMDYQHTYPYMVCMENPLMESSIEGMIDPELKPSTSSWAPPQMQRYLTDSDKSSLFSYPMTETVFSEPISHRDDGVTPFPSSLLQRRDSPSFSHMSSTSSSALSPPGESDCYRPQSPATPSDSTAMSPYIHQYDSFASRAHTQLYHQFTGLADDCVKPIDINPFQESPESYFEDCNLRTEFPFRGYSLSSDDSAAHMDVCNGSERIEVSRQMTPEELVAEVKEEIHIPEPPQSYPAIESEDEAASSEEIELPHVKQEDAEDDDYSPNRKQKRTKSGANRYTRNRKRRSSSVSSPEVKRVKIEPVDSAMGRSTVKPMLQGTKGNYSCTKCSKKVYFKDDNGLQNHIKKQHTRPFNCVFGFAGCHSTFASKNEWKRHCSSQHLVLNYWVCQQDPCCKASSKPASPVRNRSKPPCPQYATAPTLPRGTIFNRKDLYTQHLRRMHIPATFKKQVKQRKAIPEWEQNERDHQEKAKRTRCDLPTHMRCPARDCIARFDGANAWDDRMEHTAKHLEKAVNGSEPPVEFGGEHDTTLTDWATRPDVAIIENVRGRWRLRSPLKSSHGVPVATMDDGEEDAEGEEVDE